MYKTMI